MEIARAGEQAVSLGWRLRRRLLGPGIVRDALRSAHPRRALVLYTVWPFRVRKPTLTHQNLWQVIELTRALDEIGYAVDVVEYDERNRDLLRGVYHLVIDLHPRDPTLYDGFLAPGARTIAYITGKNPAFSNAAELERLRDLERRRGARLRPRRQVPPFPKAKVEGFDGFFYFGDASTLDTYREFRLPPSFRLVNNGYDDVPPTDPAIRDPRRFLFLGGTGQVHKGLDLLLELFSATPELELTVCSPFRAEADFARAYARELHRMPNIRAAGFVDVRSGRFRELQAPCGTLLSPSCSEGQGGNVTVALSYGLPCVVGPNCGFDDPEIEVMPDCRGETLERLVGTRAAEDRAVLAARARASLALMQRRYRPQHYAEAIRSALRAVADGTPRTGARTGA